MNDSPIEGYCDDKFATVRDAFENNFKQSGEIGARVCVIQEGETVVDLLGGFVDAEKTTRWTADTLVCCISVTKGVVALAAHLLRERGQLDYDQPVAHYWPEFAANGKDAITVRQAMAHQASLAIIDNAEPGDAVDWDLFVSKIAAQAPNWAPCTDEDITRVAQHIPNADNELMTGGLINESTQNQFRPMPNDPAFLTSNEFLKIGFPSGGGVAHAEALARMFAPLALGGSYAGVTLYSEETLSLMCQQQWNHDDSLFGNDFRVALGLLLHTPFSDWVREGNVGTAGAGGFCAFADPDNRFSFGYTPNRYTNGYGLGDEPKRLMEAVYAASR